MDVHQSVIERRREFFEVEPDVEGTCWRHRNIKVEFVEPVQYVIAFGLEMDLECPAFLCSMNRI